MYSSKRLVADEFFAFPMTSVRRVKADAANSLPQSRIVGILLRAIAKSAISHCLAPR
jgi:hypothetical protein